MSDNPESQITKAFEILNGKQVAKNITTLLNDYFSTCDGISIDRGVPNLNELLTTLKLKRVDKSIKFSFANKVVHLLAVDMHSTSFPDGEDCITGDLILLFNGECVLHNSLGQNVDVYGSSYSLVFYPFSLKMLKAGAWIDDLAYLVKTIKDFKEQEARKKAESDSARTASNIDLGDYK